MQICSIHDVINKVFIDKPLPPCTYNLQLSENILKNKSAMLKTLLTILVEGAKKIYGNSINPGSISDEQFQLLKKYIRSIGFETKYNYTFDDLGNPRLINIWFEPYLHDYTCNGIKY